MAIVISVALSKGGVGKTTTAVNIAAGLVLKGKRTLLIDLDPSADATYYCGLDTRALDAKGIHNLFLSATVHPRDIILKLEYGLHLMPSHKKLADVAQGIKSMQVKLVKQIIEDLHSDYDYIILDTPPKESHMMTNALNASDYVIIPLQPHPFAIEDVEEFLVNIKIVQDNLNPNLEVFGLLHTMYQKNLILPNLLIKQEQEKYPAYALPVRIGYTVLHQESQFAKLPLVIFRPEDACSKMYLELVDLIIQRGEHE